MATAYAQINPNILLWARERAQMSANVLAKKLSVSTDQLDAWEKGDKPPTFKQAQKFADKTHIPFGYLFLTIPPKEDFPLPDLRTIGNEAPRKPSTELIDMVQIVLQRQQWFLAYLKQQGIGDNPHIGHFNTSSSVNEIVHSLRKTLGVSLYPDRGKWENYFRILVKRIEDVGVLVMRQSYIRHHTRLLSIKEFRGFAIYDQIAPVVFINQADAPSARLFTLIHELAHIWIAKSGITDAEPNTTIDEEILCNAVAAEFLVPAEEFLKYWDGDRNWEENIPILERHFHVSKWVIARRAQSLQKISITQYQEYIDHLYEQYKKYKSNNPISPYRIKKGQASERFSKALVSEALSGRVLLRDAGQLLGMAPGKIGNFAKELGI